MPFGPNYELAFASVKVCGKCKKMRPEADFHRRGPILQAWCRECRKSYDAEYHARNRARRRERRRLKAIEFRQWYWALKESLPCTDCGKFFPHPAMTWDHLPGYEKRDDVGSLTRTSSRRVVLDEIAKCEIVCANCHALRTFERGRGVAQPG